MGLVVVNSTAGLVVVVLIGMTALSLLGEPSGRAIVILVMIITMLMRGLILCGWGWRLIARNVPQLFI